MYLHSSGFHGCWLTFFLGNCQAPAAPSPNEPGGSTWRKAYEENPQLTNETQPGRGVGSVQHLCEIHMRFMYSWDIDVENLGYRCRNPTKKLGI